MDLLDSKLMILRRALGRVAGESIQAGGDSMGHQRHINANAEYATLGTSRKVYVGNTLAGTAVLPLIAPPTTTPSWVLWNGDEQRSLIMLAVGVTLKSDTNTGLGQCLLGGVTIQPQLDVTMAAYAGAVIKGANGQDDTAKCRIVGAPVLLGVPAYDVLVTQPTLVQTGPVGAGMQADLKGAFVVPPKFGFALAVVGLQGAAADALYAVSFRFASLLVELEAA
jgi:hypothetical protein